MSTLSRIEKEYIEAYKAKQTDKVSVLRMIKAALKNLQVELQREPEEAEVVDLLIKQAKQRTESAEVYRKAGRDALADKELMELAIVKEYLPQALSPEELAAAVDQAIADSGAAGPADMGKVMQALMQQYKGRMDGKEASSLVRSRLTAA